MERRKFLLGMGAVAAGGAAAMGTGAFSSATIPDRALTVDVQNDLNSTIALIPGDDPDITISDNGELVMELGNVNIDSTYTWGDPNNPKQDHAFSIRNQDDAGQSYAMAMEYGFNKRDWIEVDGGKSFINFELFSTSHGSSTETYPHQNYAQSYSLANPEGDWSPSGSYRFEPGEEYYMVVTVDTTGPNASVEDELAGRARFRFTDNLSITQQSWPIDELPPGY